MMNNERRKPARTTIAGIAAGVLLLLAAACSGTTGAAPEDIAVARTGATAAAGGRPPCQRPPAAPVVTAAVDGVPHDLDVTSFDGTRIRAHWFPRADLAPGATAPVVLMGPGWGLGGDTNEDAVGVFGALNIASLRDAGFHVLTWDPRGFGASAGTATVDSPDHEGKDVQVLLDWVAQQPGVQLDGPGDPRAGMVGGSYGGGIQLVVAGIDCRVDALVPVVAWHSLETSLHRAETPKTGWANILIKVAASRSVDPHATNASTAANERGVIDPEDVAWFRERGPGDLVGKITVPTLLIQGTVDTLFTLDEAITNYGILDRNGVPVSMLWFCGGHGTCLTSPGDIERVPTAAIAWLKRYVLDDTTVDTGPRVSLIDQNGTSHTADAYPLPAGAPITATGSGTLTLTADGGAGPVTDAPAGGSDILRGLVLPVTPARAANAVDVPIPAPSSPTLVVGAPRVQATYQGTVPAGDRPTRVFAQLVDADTGRVFGNQITPIQVTLDGQSHTLDVALETVAYAMIPASHVTLQLVATTVAYAEPRLGGSVQFDTVRVEQPTTTTP